MNVYFVRHGEGFHNTNSLFSTPDFELTEKGKQQAKEAGERLKTLPIDVLIVSPYKRTVQTAEIINKFLNKPIILSELAKEIVRPSEIAGKSHDEPNVREIFDLIEKNAGDSNYHYSDEENYHDLLLRAKQLLKYLEGLSDKYENVCVVTHGVFIKMLVMEVILEDKFEVSGFVNAYKNLTLSNSGLTLLKNKDSEWRLITLNDQSHLAE